MADLTDILLSLGLIAFRLTAGYVYRICSSGKEKTVEEINELKSFRHQLSSL